MEESGLLTQLQTFVGQLTSSISPSDVLTILGSVIGIGMTFVLMWFGVRKAVSIFKSAFKKGDIHA